MKLPQFLNIVDEYTKKMSHSEIEKFVHELARKVSENDREGFLASLKISGEPEIGTNDDDRTDITKRIMDIMPELEEINRGDVCLDSEYNEEWDDWYNSDVDEILFYDPQDILCTVREAIELIHTCIDMELYEDGYQLCETMCYLDVHAQGDYNDFDGSPLGIEELFDHHLLEGDFDQFKKEALYLAYIGNQISSRAEEMYDLFESFHGLGVHLEDVLQVGNHELPEFDTFLPLWIEYLGKQSGRRASELLKEAQSLVQDDVVLVENARKYVNEHPELYLQILKMKAASGMDDRMLEIGLEAIDAIPSKLLVRSTISLWTAHYAHKLCRFDIREKCWLEAFRSDPSVINYLRISFLPWDSKQYHDQILSMIDTAWKESKSNGNSPLYFAESMRESSISRNAYCSMMFFEQQFDRMEKTGMSVKENLGWSSTFMKEGLAFLLLLLYRGDAYPVGMRSMLSRSMSACGFTKEAFYFGTGEADDKTDIEVFTGILANWKDTVDLSEKEVDKWLKKLDTWIQRRVCGIMDANRRNYYGECAEFIAAFGEVQESLGETGAKARIMEQYRREYSRRRAFHEELRRYGMRK